MKNWKLRKIQKNSSSIRFNVGEQEVSAHQGPGSDEHEQEDQGDAQWITVGKE